MDWCQSVGLQKIQLMIPIFLIFFFNIFNVIVDYFKTTLTSADTKQKKWLLIPKVASISFSEESLAGTIRVMESILELLELLDYFLNMFFFRLCQTGLSCMIWLLVSWKVLNRYKYGHFVILALIAIIGVVIQQTVICFTPASFPKWIIYLARVPAILSMCITTVIRSLITKVP